MAATPIKQNFLPFKDGNKKWTITCKDLHSPEILLQSQLTYLSAQQSKRDAAGLVLINIHMIPFLILNPEQPKTGS